MSGLLYLIWINLNCRSNLDTYRCSLPLTRYQLINRKILLRICHYFKRRLILFFFVMTITAGDSLEYEPVLVLVLMIRSSAILTGFSKSEISVFRWFKFTLKPPYSIAHDNLRLAIWDTSFWTFWLKFGHKGP